MPKYQVSWNFARAKGGWSESLFRSDASHESAYQSARNLIQLRMPLMGEKVSCESIRVSDMDIIGDASISERLRIAMWLLPPPEDQDFDVEYYKITGNLQADMWWTRLKIQYSDVQQRNIGHTFMGGLPDAFFVAPKEFIPTAKWVTAFQKWRDEVIAAQWQTHGHTLVAPAGKKRIDKVVAPGNALVTVTSPNHGLVPGNPIYIGKVQTNRGNFFGDFIVSTVPNLNEFTLLYSDAISFTYVRKGYVKLKLPEYFDIKGCAYTHPTKRNAGRPFGAPVGRRKKVVSIQ